MSQDSTPAKREVVEPLESLKADIQQLRANTKYLTDAFREIGEMFGRAGASEPEEDNRKPAKALLKFHEGLLIFSSAIVAAIFIGLPNTYNVTEYVSDSTGGTDGVKQLAEVTGAAEVAGFQVVAPLTMPELYAHATSFLAAAALVTAVAALFTQLTQSRMNKVGFSRRNGWLWAGSVLTAVAIGAGALAALPLLMFVR